MPAGNQSWHRLFVQVLILLILITAGVLCGFFIATKTGIAGRIARSPLNPATMENQTSLRLNGIWPLVQVSDAQGQPVTLDTILSRRKTVISIVSGGCDACRLFLEEFVQTWRESDSLYQFVLLSVHPDFFIKNHNCRAFRITQESLDKYAFHQFPTIVGVDESGRIKFVSSGYTSMLNVAFIKKYL